MDVRPASITLRDRDLPEFGELDGQPVRLADVEANLPPARWPDVLVRFPKEHKRLGGVALRPWRGSPILAYTDDGRPAGPA